MARRIFWYGGIVLLTSCVSNDKLYVCYQCPPVDVIDMVEQDEDPRDRPAYDRATYKCSLEPVNKCLVQFVRIEPGDYFAKCGRKEQQLCRIK